MGCITSSSASFGDEDHVQPLKVESPKVDEPMSNGSPVGIELALEQNAQSKISSVSVISACSFW